MSHYILKDRNILNNLIAELNTLPLDFPEKYEVAIKKHKKDLTGQQRKYWHKCLQIISDENGTPMTELKMKIKYEVLELQEVKVNGELHLYPPSSEDISRQEYGELIEATLQVAYYLNLTMPVPGHYGYET